MKSIKFNQLMLWSVLMGFSTLCASGEVCHVEKETLSFTTGAATQNRHDISELKTCSQIKIGLPSGYSFSSAQQALPTSSYVVVHNPNQNLHEGSYGWMQPADAASNIFMATKNEDGLLPTVEISGLTPGKDYQFTFTLMNPTARWNGECQPTNGDAYVLRTSLVNPQTNNGSGINAKGYELTEIRHIEGENREDTYTRSGSGCTNQERFGNRTEIVFTYTFSTDDLTAVRLRIEDQQSMKDCSAIGLSDLTISQSTCLGISSQSTIICGGKQIELRATGTLASGAKYKWYRRYRTESTFSLFSTTQEPMVEDMPSDTAQYYVASGDMRSDTIKVNVADKCLYITPHYSSDLCSDDTNTLIASGYLVLDNIDSKNFLWEEYDDDSKSWTKLSSNTMKQRVRPEKTTRYRVTFAGESTEYTHTVAPCASLVCEQLDSKTVFLETFGFFIDSVTYVDTKDEVRRGVVPTPSGNLKIERYWAPDPYDYVVRPTEFTPAINSYDNQQVVFDGSVVMCGTNGHQYALLDPRNPDPTSDSEVRRNGAYQWCHNENNPSGNYRIEDGFYALVRNPSEADCGNRDFWDANDHTGNTNGAMLMVNCGPTKATIYSQKVEVGCSNLLLNFSAYLANAITDYDKDGQDKTTTPVKVTFKIFDRNMNLLGSEDSEEILCKKELSWTQQAMQFKSGNETELYVQLVNNGETGYGNDILVDDISFSICLPKVVLVTDGMDIDNPEVVHICNDTTITLYAMQKKEILENPLYRFQYRIGEDDPWKDVDPSLTDYSSNKITIQSSDSRLWGEVEFRVVAADNMEVLRKVIEGLPLSPCDMYSMANSTLTIDNRYHGPMSPDVQFFVCKGDHIEMKGSRECDKEGKWLTDWEWEWRDEKDNVLPGYSRSSDLEKKTIPYRVLKTEETFYFVGYDDVCSYRQKFSLSAKDSADITAKSPIWEGCDSLVIVRDSLTIRAIGLDPVLKWSIDGGKNVIYGDTFVIKPSALPASGVVMVDIDSVNMYCPLTIPFEVPYRIYAGSSLSVSLSAGGIEHLCLDPVKYDTVPLMAKVTPEASAADVKFYLWSVNGAPLDTTTTPLLILSTDPQNKYHDLLVPGAQLNFEVRVADGVCFTVDEPSDPGSFYLEVNETYTIKLEAYPNDSICLTDLQSDTVLVLNAIATSVAHPGNSDVQKNIKKYVWSVDGVQFAETKESSFVLLKSNHLPIFDKYLKAGTAPVFSVSAIDGICFQSLGDAPSDEMKIVFNEAYSMIVSPSDKTLCVPEDELDDRAVLLELTVKTDPADAQKHVKEYMWYMNDEEFRTTKEPSVDLTYGDLKDLVGQKVRFAVKSYDGICSSKNNPASNANDVNIDVRSGGYTLSLEVGTDRLCIDTLNPENNKIVLSALVKPGKAKANIDMYYWMDNGSDIGQTVDTFFVLTQQTHPAIFTAGKKAVFNVKTFDAICAEDWVYGVGDGKEFDINESYKMELIADGDSLCYDDENSAVLHLEAKVTPAPAANHIQKYRWYRDGVLFETTKSASLDVTNAKYPGSLVAGPAHSFSVDSYDGICYSVENPSESPAKPIAIGFKYQLKLTHVGKDSICLGTDSLVLRAKVSPSSSKASVQYYIWTMELNGAEKTIATTYAPEDSLVISQSRFPDLFKAGTAPTFRVKSVDGICYTVENPNVSDKINIYFNEPYMMKLKTSSSTVCFSVEDNTELVLTAEVTPADAAKFIKWYRWYKDGVLIDSTRENKIRLTPSAYPTVMVPGVKPKFTVDSYDDFCYTAQDPAISDGVEVLLNEKYDMKLGVDGNSLCMESDAVVLRAVVNPSSSKVNIQKYFWKVNGELFETTDGLVDSLVLSTETYPELLDRLRGTEPKFSVESIDGICYTIENPAKSEPVGIAIGGHFTLSLEAPSDSICFDGPSAVSLKLTAKVDPAASAGLIKNYRWYKNGVLFGTTKTPYVVITEADYPGVVQPGENPTFSVDAYDDVCYTEDNPAKSGGTKVVINFKFSIVLDNGGKDYLCVGSDSLVIKAVVTPAGSANNIQRYYWTKDGVPFDTTTVGEIVLSRETYPTLFSGSSVPKFGVLAVDGICYTDNDPATSSEISIKVNKIFDLKMKPNKDEICASGANSTVLLEAVVNPSESQEMIERYVWHKIDRATGVSEQIGEPTVGPTKAVSELGFGQYAFYVTAYDGICFSVNPATSDSVNVSVRENIFVTLTADNPGLCEDASVKLTATVTQGQPREYELFDANGLLIPIKSSAKSISFTVIPTKENHEYFVRAYDAVCNNNDATAATSGNPVSIAVYEPIELELSTDKKLVCLGDTVRLRAKLKKGTPIRYEWSAVTYGGSEHSVMTKDASEVVIDVPAEAGYQAYTLVASDGVCEDAIVSISDILVKEKIEMKLLSDLDGVVIGGSVNFMAEVTSGEPVLYTWKADDRVVATTRENRLLEFPKSPSVYTVEATDSVCSTVTAQMDMLVQLPTAFTPYDKDGLNDIFMEDFKVVIFNRFGQVIFEGENGWDGSTYSNVADPDKAKRSCGAMADPGVYFYSVILKDGKEQKGSIEVVRM